MLGTRGVRLGLLHPEVYETQARAIFRAARAVRERTGGMPRVEIMIPLVAYARELELARDIGTRSPSRRASRPATSAWAP
jgi:pyruvate, orthophosphate dikinase